MAFALPSRAIIYSNVSFQAHECTSEIRQCNVRSRPHLLVATLLYSSVQLVIKINLLLYFFFFRKVMETKSMLYLVTEYASNGEMFSKFHYQVQ